jgi:excisionase family DNA binding protein
MQAQRLRGVSLPAGIEPEFISVDQTCVVTGLGRTGIYELIAAGKLESVKVRKRRLVRLRSARAVNSAA